MRKRLRGFANGIPIVLFVVCLAFYIGVLNTPPLFLAGAAVGLAAYFGSYGLVRLGWFPLLKWILITIVLLFIAFALYSYLYPLQLSS